MNLPGNAWRESAKRNGTGIGASFFLHALLLGLILYLSHRTLRDTLPVERVLPVSLIAQSEGPQPEAQRPRAAGARSAVSLPRERVAHRTPSAVSPSGLRPPVDDLQAKLEALSRLRQPSSDTRLSGQQGEAAVPESGNDENAGGQGAYTTRDIVRAQILRRWSLDMAKLGDRKFSILIRVQMKPDGTVVAADIVDKTRLTHDPVFRWIAISARNAVVLSSPLTLPAGSGGDDLDFVLRLNPRDTLQ